MKIKEFILENEVVVKNWLVEKNIIDEDDIDNIGFEDGFYVKYDENDDEESYETDEICSVVEMGIDFSFKRKFVKDEYGDGCELKLIINNKIVYVLIYNI